MKASGLLGATAAYFCLGVAVPLLAAPAAIIDPPPRLNALSDSDSGQHAAVMCQPSTYKWKRTDASNADLVTDTAIQSAESATATVTEGGLGDGYAVGGNVKVDAPAYQNAQPGYEIRILLASANILAGNGQQQACESVLATTRGLYKVYAADMHGSELKQADSLAWQRRQIAAAKPVSTDRGPYRSDELIDTAVHNPKDEALGIQDLVKSTKTGRIAYLVVPRDGIFGFDKKYVPAPWDGFRATHDARFLMLDATKASIDAAPEVTYDETLLPAQFDKYSKQVDASWKNHLTD